MKLTINDPCHENWSAMTPNTQGAFCKSCMKDVVDFSKMGIAEIKSFFSEKESTKKICGRFKESQLQELSFDEFFSKFTYWNFAKKFSVIFFFTFGFAVFSNSVAAQNEQAIIGKTIYVPDKNPKADTTKKQNPKQIKDLKNIKTGKVKCENTFKKQAMKNEPVMIMGDIVVPVEEKKVAPSKK